MMKNQEELLELGKEMDLKKKRGHRFIKQDFFL
jgi:hypothetical protein